jgi:hypothetical protein
LAEIPDDRRIAQAYSRGRLFCGLLPEYRPLFENLLARVETIENISLLSSILVLFAAGDLLVFAGLWDIFWIS